MAFLPAMTDGHYFSHETAAALLHMRLPERQLGGSLHVTAVQPARPPRIRGVIGHKRAKGPRTLTLTGGARVSDPIETWCDLGASFTVDELIVVGDGIVRRQHPLGTIEMMREAVSGRAGARGTRNLREAIEQVRANTDSPRETMLRLILTRAGFPEPGLNLPIFNRYGARIAHGDLTWERYRTILEYDGAHHRLDERQYNIDIARLVELMEEGWRVIRVNKSLMAMRAVLLGKVDTALRAGGWRGGR